MRIRTVKPEFWSDEKVGRVSRNARLLFIGMWNLSDDWGVHQANLQFLKSQLFCYDKISFKNISTWVNELLREELIIPFDANGNKYFYIKNFKKHQVINRPSKFRNPPPPIFTEDSLNNHGIITVGSGSGSGKGKEVEVEGESEGEEEQNQSQTPFSLSKEKPQKPKTENLINSISEALSLKENEKNRLHTWIVKKQSEILLSQGEKALKAIDWLAYTRTNFRS